MDDRLPSGRVTFAFTDVVGSTRAFAEHGDGFVDALRRLHAVQAEVVGTHRGVVVKTDGDGAFLVFSSAADAVTGLQALQAAVEGSPPVPGVPRLRLRAGAHTGDAVPVNGDYLSFAVHVAARVAATAGAGQVIVSGDVIDDLPHPGDAVRLGDFSLKDIEGGVTLWRAGGDDAPPAAAPLRLTNVSPARTSFVGREGDLTWLRKRLAAPGLVTLTGPGGLGKTRIVSQLAERHWNDYAGGAWLVELAPLEDGDAILSAIAAVLDVRGTPDLARVVAEVDRRGAVVLVLDNCEHLIDAAADVAGELVTSCPMLRLVVTSREPLGLPDEEVRRMQPLTSEQEDGSSGAAVELLLTRVAAAGGDPAAFDPDTSRRVCTLVDGLPLAIELAAAAARELPVPALVTALEQQTLDLGRRGGAPRQRSLDAMVSWSLDLLDPLERDAAAVLSVFPGGFGADAAAEVLADALGPSAASLAGGLARRSLLDIDGDRYRMLATVRWVTRQHLAASPALAEGARRALYDWCRKLAVATDLPWSPDDGVFDNDLALAMEDALAWAIPRGLTECETMLWLCVRFYEHRAARPRLNELCRTALDSADLGTPASAAVAAVAAARLKGSVVDAGNLAAPVDPATALALLAEGLRGTPRQRWRTALVTALYLVGTGDPDGAITAASTALSTVEATPELSLWRASTLIALGITLVGPRPQEAEVRYREGMAQARADHLLAEYDLAATNLGELLIDHGRPAAALEVLPRLSSATSSLVRAVSLSLRAEGELGCGRRQLATTIAAEALASLRRLMTTDPSAAAYVERLAACGFSVGDTGFEPVTSSV